MLRKILPIFLLVLCLACNNHKLTELNKSVEKSIIENNDKQQLVLILDTISSFKWDEIIVVGPYVDLEKLSKEIGYNFNRFPKTIKHHDQFILIGFLDNKNGVKYIEIVRNLVLDSLFNGSGTNYKIYNKTNCNLLIK